MRHVQVFANSQLGSGKEMIESTSSGALQMPTDGAGALGAFLQQRSVIEAPYLWHDAALDAPASRHFRPVAAPSTATQTVFHDLSTD